MHRCKPQKFVNDLGRSLLLAGRFNEAQEVLERAAAMDPADDLARQNLLMCKEKRQQEPVRRGS